MKAMAFRAFRQIYRLELYELMGILVSAIAVTVFFVFSKQLDGSIGVPGYHWRVVSNVMGVYQNPLAWVFTSALALMLVLVGFLRRANHQFLRKLGYVIRILIAFCVMLAIYEIVNFYITVFNPVDRDSMLAAIDRTLCFGKLPSQWMVSLISKPLTDVLSTAYMSWFALVYGTILLMMSHSRRAAVEYVFTALFTFYIGYLTYVLVPAVGPLYTVTYTHAIGGIAGSFASDPKLLAHDCFPSLHTGITVVMLTHVWRYRRKWLWLYAPIGALIIWSTLYLRFHYAIDVVAGLGLSVAVCQLAPLMVSWWERKRLTSLAYTTENVPVADITRPMVSELA